MIKSAKTAWSHSSTVVAVVAVATLGVAFVAPFASMSRRSNNVPTPASAPVVAIVDASCSGRDVTVWLSDGTTVLLEGAGTCPARVRVFVVGQLDQTAEVTNID